MQKFELRFFLDILTRLHRTIVDNESLLRRLVQDKESLKQQKRLEQMNGEINKHLNVLLFKTTQLENEKAASVPAPVPASSSLSQAPPTAAEASGERSRRPTMGAARMQAQAKKTEAEMSVSEIFQIDCDLDEFASSLGDMNLNPSSSSSSSSSPLASSGPSSKSDLDPFAVETELQTETDQVVAVTQRTKCFQQTIRKMIPDKTGRAWWTTNLGGRVSISHSKHETRTDKRIELN